MQLRSGNKEGEGPWRPIMASSHHQEWAGQTPKADDGGGESNEYRVDLFTEISLCCHFIRLSIEVG